jgi:hypothetical protein
MKGREEGVSKGKLHAHIMSVQEENENETPDTVECE